MKCSISIPRGMEERLLEHLFQNDLEQGAFLFSRALEDTGGELGIEAVDMYLVPPEGWTVQLEFHLEMDDAERAKIMKMARDGGFAVVDCHSHPGSRGRVDFSPSDRSAITDFAGYAKWKLPGQPYAAMVWGEVSVDAVVWTGDFHEARPVQEVVVDDGDATRILVPRGSWFRPLRALGRRKPRARRNGE